MNIKNIVVIGCLAGMLLLLLMVVINMLMNAVIPTDMSRYGGMRGSDDPVMITSMTWPLDFYVSTALREIISFPVMGILFTEIWKVS